MSELPLLVETSSGETFRLQDADIQLLRRLFQDQPVKQEMFSLEETARILGVSRQTMRRLHEQGVVRTRMVGGSVRISDSEIQRIKRSGTRKTA